MPHPNEPRRGSGESPPNKRILFRTHPAGNERKWRKTITQMAQKRGECRQLCDKMQKRQKNLYTLDESMYRRIPKALCGFFGRTYSSIG